MDLKRTFLTVSAAAAFAAAGMYPVILSDWFSQTFAGLEDGAAFTGAGATGGGWLYVTNGVATVDTVGGRKCISINTSGTKEDAIQFKADSVSAGSTRIDFSIGISPLPKTPVLGEQDWAALCLLSTNQFGVRIFGGYAKDGWKELYGRGLAERSFEWLDCRAEFEYVTNVQGRVTSAFVTYYSRTPESGYVPLTDADGDFRFEMTTNVIGSVAFSGKGFVGDFRGYGMTPDLSRVCVWQGPTEGPSGQKDDIRWGNPANWVGGKVPGDGDLAQVASGKSVVYGKYTNTLWEASTISIVSNVSMRIGPYGDAAGNVEISCGDGDYTSLGTVYVDAGSTLQAGGKYSGIDMAFGSTLIVKDTVKDTVGLEIRDKPILLDGVTLEVSATPAGKEGGIAISAPYGSGGGPEKLEIGERGWWTEWHDCIDGRANLWIVNDLYSIGMATWKDEAVGNLVLKDNWGEVKPKANVAARMGNGQAHVNPGDAFSFARWFEIGQAGTGEVDMSGGTIGGNADVGGAVVVASECGTGLLDVVGGLVRPYDYLWRYALTLGLGTNSTGTVKVRGGTVDAAGGSVSVGMDSTARLEFESGRVLAGDAFGVGYSSTFGMSGGALAVSNSIYIGRASRVEAYDVEMTVSAGTVSNLASGAIWVGSFGGLGSKATLALTGGEVYATNRFVCGGYRSARVDVEGGTLVAPEICVGFDLTDNGDVASFNLLSGRVETAGFTTGTNGVRTVTLTGGELVATATNDDFFRGLESVRLDGETVFANQDDVAVKSVLTGPGDFVKSGFGTNTISGYAAWNGLTAVEEGVLDMDGCLLTGEILVETGASVIRAKYDEIDALMAFLSEQDWMEWTSGTPSDRPYAYVDFSLTNGAAAVTTDGDGVVKGAIEFVVDKATGAGTFRGRTVLGWTELFFWDGMIVEAEAKYDLRMLFDFRTVGLCAKPYVVYYVKRGNVYERLVNADGVSAFPAAGGAMSIMSFSGVPMTAGKQLNLASGREFYWIGPDGGKWNDGANWSYTPDGTAAGRYPDVLGASGSMAFVEKPVLITLPAAARTALLYVNANVRLSGEKAIQVSSAIAGVGTLTLSNATLHASGTDVLVTVPVIAQDGTANRLLSTPSSCAFVMDGPLRGSGELDLTALNRRPMGGTILAGDNSEFSGMVKIYPWASDKDCQRLDMPSIAVPQASSANAQWEINVEHEIPEGFDLRPGVDFFGMANATYRFGSLKANFHYNGDFNAYWAKDGITLEVGALNRDSYARGTCAGTNGVIEWVAPSAVFSNEVAGLTGLKLSGGGRIAVPSAEYLPAKAITFADRGGELIFEGKFDISGLITNSTAAVVYNGGNELCEWTGAPGDSNSGGFVKRGKGTLIWCSVPSFRIDVTVEEGVLIVPFGTQLGRITILAGAALVVDCVDAVENALVFSASGSNISRISAPYLQFANVPEDYKITLTYGENYSVVAANGTTKYDWTGAGQDASWNTLKNWLVGNAVPSRPPQNLDIVQYGLGCATTRLDTCAAALALDGTGSIVLTGSQVLETLLRFRIDGTLDLCPDPMSVDMDSPDYYGAVTNVLGLTSAAEFSAGALRGEGRISTGDSNLVVSSPGSSTNRFVGTLRAANFVKSGSGTFVFVGDGSFSGQVSVSQGTLRIGNYRDIDGIRTDFDASDADGLEEDGLEMDEDGKVACWNSRVGTGVFTYKKGQQAVSTKAYFGGRRAVMLRPDVNGQAFSRYDLSPANASGNVSRSLFMVYVPVGSLGYGYSQNKEGDKRGLRLYNRGQGGASYWSCPQQGFGINGIFTGYSYGSLDVSDDEPSLTFWSDTALTDGAVEQLGTANGNLAGFRGAIGEIVAFTNVLTHAEREVTTGLLMSKWGIPGAPEFAPIHADTPVTMSAGASLDLSGQTLRVGSFTGAGTITNGVLKTADGKITQSGGALSVPAVEGMAYVASHAGEKLIIRDAQGVKVRIVLKQGWFAAGNTGRRAIFCESKDIEWDIWRKDVKPVSEGDGWWSIAGGGFAVRLR